MVSIRKIHVEKQREAKYKFVMMMMLMTSVLFYYMWNGYGDVIVHKNDVIKDLVVAAKVRGCSPDDDLWMRMLHMLMPHATTFVDIGSNKGYTAMRFFQYWDPAFELSSIKLHEDIRGLDGVLPELSECGACSDCHNTNEPFVNILDRLCSKQSMSSSNPNESHRLQKVTKRLCANYIEHHPQMNVYSFDGNKYLVDKLNEINKNPTWHINHAAFVDFCLNPSIYFQSNGETGKVDDKKGDKVPCYTVDRLNMKKIDILKIDTEGNDPNVIYGSKRTLKRGLIEVMLFEYNQDWPSKTTLHEVVQFLWGYGMHCFMEGKNFLVDLSLELWDDETYSKRWWSNIFCVKKKSSIEDVFKQYTINRVRENANSK